MSETISPAEPTTKPRGIINAGGRTYYLGTGRRKKSVARVRLAAGQGKFIINDRPLDSYFTETRDRTMVHAPLVSANLAGTMDVLVNVHGGGHTGQSGAILQGLGRALTVYDATLRKSMQDGGFLTRDSRMKERKKYGLRGARRAYQFSKR
ncbi:MAG: 30S ribosomal protein S9 [Planctomycetes bacterium]|jgi:small subunit ribosomal protein S9|nr:30S ribosomal protein S9 [Planctomycetota bacterium]MDA8376202.1 30S ribosomal protein S9 [Planctomycetia bacterium]